MPEIAEVKRYVDQLNAEYKGQDLLAVEAVGGRFLKEGIYGLSNTDLPLKNVSFHAKGKLIYWQLENSSSHFSRPGSDGKEYFFLTLGMSGSFGKQNKHSGIKFTFSKGDVFFNDIRHFGTVKLGQDSIDLEKKLKSLGWDPLQNPFFHNSTLFLLRKRNYKTIAEVLLDQKVFAGVGNYIRSEAMYRSKINPFRIVASLSDIEIEILCNDIISVVQEAYNCGGATLATYSDMYGNVGTYYQQFKVYGKKKDPLGNTVIAQTAPDGRTVHWVKEVQV